MRRKQEQFTAADLDALEALCAKLDTMPYKANYLIDRPYVCAVEYRALRRNIIFWSSGYGWRLHTYWRAQLAAKRAGLEPQSDCR